MRINRIGNQLHNNTGQRTTWHTLWAPPELCGALHVCGAAACPVYLEISRHRSSRQCATLRDKTSDPTPLIKSRQHWFSSTLHDFKLLLMLSFIRISMVQFYGTTSLEYHSSLVSGWLVLLNFVLSIIMCHRCVSYYVVLWKLRVIEFPRISFAFKLFWLANL